MRSFPTNNLLIQALGSGFFSIASVVGVVVSSLALHCGDPGSIPSSAYRQFGFMPKMEVHTCYNSQKVTAASV